MDGCNLEFLDALLGDSMLDRVDRVCCDCSAALAGLTRVDGCSLESFLGTALGESMCDFLPLLTLSTTGTTGTGEGLFA